MAQRRIEYQGEYFELSYERIQAQFPTHQDSNHVSFMLFLHGWGSNKELRVLLVNILISGNIFT